MVSMETGKANSEESANVCTQIWEAGWTAIILGDVRTRGLNEGAVKAQDEKKGDVGKTLERL